MNEERIMESPPWSDPRGLLMKTPDDVEEMLRLKGVRVGAEADRVGPGLQPAHGEGVSGSGGREAVQVT
jgi:hypothetical protein